MAVVGRGVSVDGDVWELDAAGDADDLRLTVRTTTPDGRAVWGTGCAGPALPLGRRLGVTTGSDDGGPTVFLASVAAEVRAVVVTLSDGTREDLVLHGDAGALGARVAVLVHPRELDIHRVDLMAADGVLLAEEY